MAAANSTNTKSAQYEERRLTSPYSDITKGWKLIRALPANTSVKAEKYFARTIPTVETGDVIRSLSVPSFLSCAKILTQITGRKNMSKRLDASSVYG